jgi:uncharacterized protein (TIGR02421 family)
VNKRSSKPDETITSRLIRIVADRLLDDKPVWRTLPMRGRLHIDRQLPFLCVYRRPTTGNDAGTDRLVTTEAAYLTVSGRRKLHAGLSEMVGTVARTLVHEFGAFLILEVWSGSAGDDNNDAADAAERQRPRFRILAPKMAAIGGFVDRFDEALSRIKVAKQAAQVRVEQSENCHPKRMSPIISTANVNDIRCIVLGLEVRPIYRDPDNGQVYPVVLRELRRGLTRALRQTFYEFTRLQTTHRPKHYHVLGRRALVKAVWEVDRGLADVSNTFDFLLQATPVNAQQAWLDFRKSRFERAPTFLYRPLPADPSILKRQLFAAPVERVEDPALALLFREKQDELDRQITMLSDINTPRFVHGSVQLFGGVDDQLLGVATDLLTKLPSRTREDSKSGHFTAEQFVLRATEEIEYYKRQWPEMKASVKLRDDIASGLMVSHGSLLVGKNTKIPKSRAEALLQHEVGTHVLTYYNGRAQPFRQLYAGLAGYEALQEGLAVLAEYLVGGLSRPRLRLLAARVIAVRRMVEGASFVETYRELVRTFRFERRTAYTIVMRIFRGGGLTKDAVYLRGLCQVLQYLGKGGKLEPLYLGKIAVEHIPIIRELQWRQVLRDPPLIPRFMNDAGVAARLERLRTGKTVLDLIKR